MSQIPYCDSTGRLSVEVHLSYAADVFLVDRINFQRYQSGQDFDYFGGHYSKTPVTISVVGSGRWYLIVVGGGHYKYRFY
ncbi:DUF1883 domain-containing protein [Clostridium chrysemydis]|uniref:DUF1883 domain-containing protein n=1 Tax=Clostridium chrysemydis TaxID=2665504 RepID=UPI0018848F17|nr:DUF1883 domain-containing protein [Clostridium chrysemydis]